MKIHVLLGAVNFELIIESVLKFLECNLPTADDPSIPTITTNPNLALNHDITYGGN